jgi:diguanylate cyclase
MVKAPSYHVLSFFAGSALTLAGVASHNRWPWRLSESGLADFANVREHLAASRPTILLAIGVTALLAILLTFRASEVFAFANRRLRRLAVSRPISSDDSVKRSKPATSNINNVRDELERQLGRLIFLIAGQLENSKEHIASLKNANAQLATVTSAIELRDLAHSLISMNEQNQHQTSDLETRLREAQAQTAALRQRLTQAERLASLDPLTSVANRRSFEQFVAAEIDKSHYEGTPLCLIMTDIDHFKRVNDTYGHSAGDRVLKAFADLLSNSVRANDLIARYGGEEFAIVLPRTPMGNAFVIAERIRCRFELHGGSDETLANEFGRLTASFGVAEIREGEPPSALVQRADQMLYEAKKKGRNKTITWSSATEGLLYGDAQRPD